MSIVNKIESISNHLENAYDSLEDIGADLSHINKNIENLSTVLDTVYDSMPKINEEGPDLILNNTRMGKMKNILKGNISQATYSGEKSLLDVSKIEKVTRNGMTCTYDSKTQEITFNGTCNTDNTLFVFGQSAMDFTANQTKLCVYYVSGSITNYCALRFYDNDYYRLTSLDLLNLATAKKLVSTSVDTYEAKNNNFRFNNGSVATNFKLKVMVTNDTDTNYEPYTGGIFSPNPNYPQDIHIVNGDNNINICGKNLLPVSTLNNKTSNGITFTNNQDGSYTLNGTATAEATFFIFDGNIKINANSKLTFSCDNLNSQIALYWYDNWATISGSNMRIGKGNPNYTTTNDIDTIQKLRINIAVNEGATVNNLIIKPMIEKSSTQTAYLPYENKQYPMYLGVENLVNPNGSNGGYNGITLTNNQDGTFTITGTSTGAMSVPITTSRPVLKANTTYTQVVETISGTKAGQIVPSFKNTGGTITYNYFTDNETKTTTEEMTCNTYNYFISTTGTTVNWTFRVSLAEGRNKSYSPYEVQPIELCKIGTYQDYIYKENNNWYLHKEIGKVILDGSKNWSYISVSQGILYRSSNSIDIDIADTNTAPYCNYFKGIPGSQQSNRENGDIYINNTTLDIIDNSHITTESFKNWLNSVNPILYYPLLTPSNIEITSQTLINQLNSLEQAKSYNNQTNISQENNDLSFIINATALMGNSD